MMQTLTPSSREKEQRISAESSQNPCGGPSARVYCAKSTRTAGVMSQLGTLDVLLVPWQCRSFGGY